MASGLLRWVRPGWRFFRTAAVAALAAWVFLAYVAQMYRIHGSSMSPTLHSGERVLVNKLGARLSLIGRGDVVVFRDPSDSETVMVKRVVGVPGDTVRFLGDDVEVLPGPGEDRSIATIAPVANASGADAPGPSEGPGPVSVLLEPGRYFVIGDNRGGSSDSRHWGAISKEVIIGEAVLRIFPWRRLGLVRP